MLNVRGLDCFTIPVGFMTRGITIAHPDDLSRPLQRKADCAAAVWHNDAMVVRDLYGDDRDVFAIRLDAIAIGDQQKSRRFSGRINSTFRNLFACCIAARSEHAGLILCSPFQMTVVRHLLFAKTLLIEQQFDLFTIAVHSHFRFLSFLAYPIPIRNNVHNGVLAPPGFQVIINVLGKAAHVKDSVL